MQYRFHCSVMNVDMTCAPYSKYSGIHLFFHPGDVGKYSFKVEWRLEESLRILVRKTAKAAEAVSRRRKQHSPLIFRRKKEALQHENLCMDS